jgi:hypothetical protein
LSEDDQGKPEGGEDDDEGQGFNGKGKDVFHG